MRTQLTLTAIAAYLALQTAFAAVPKNCIDEITSLSKKSGFDIQSFAKDLPLAVAKAKAQAKMPFGKPKDSEKTSIGMSFGCLKVFPESLGEIQSLLKDVSQELVMDAVDGQLDATQQYIPKQPQNQQQYESVYFSAGKRWNTWALNTVFPGLGSAAIMNDYVGASIQLGLSAIGLAFILTTDQIHGGIGFLGTSAIFNIISSVYYEKPYQYSGNMGGLNLATITNRRGEILPYFMYSKVF